MEKVWWAAELFFAFIFTAWVWSLLNYEQWLNMNGWLNVSGKVAGLMKGDLRWLWLMHSSDDDDGGGAHEDNEVNEDDEDDDGAYDDAQDDNDEDHSGWMRGYLRCLSQRTS